MQTIPLFDPTAIACIIAGLLLVAVAVIIAAWQFFAALFAFILGLKVIGLFRSFDKAHDRHDT